jgi:hypothetical protein
MQEQLAAMNRRVDEISELPAAESSRRSRRG